MSQRRYDGPTVIYLGAGWVLTAHHVGVGEILLDGEIVAPDYGSRHTLLNENGTGADAIVFRLAEDTEPPDLPILPLAKGPPYPGEQVVVIGFGRERDKVIQWNEEGRTQFGFEWTHGGTKRWGTNAVTSVDEPIVQRRRSTHTFTFTFDEPHSRNNTPYEAQAANGDSGGAVFVERDGRWLLAGMMILVSGDAYRPVETTIYGDTTFAADLSYYHSEILRWARPNCLNEQDDDGDQKIDFPLDPGCHSPADRDERDRPPVTTETATALGIGLAGLGVVSGVLFLMFRKREQP